MKSSGTNIIVQELKEKILNEKNCPLCSLVLDFEFNQLSQIQHQVSYDSGIRKNIAGKGGFCDFHFRQFKKIANGKTNIIFLKSIIEEGAYKSDNFNIECLICNKVNIYENELLNSFMEFLFDKINRKNFEETNGICFVHLKMITEFMEDENITKWLSQTHIKQIERMQKDFEYMNSVKSFYEIDREKRKLINILIEKLAGRKTGAL